jgi:hypothetical protein
VSQRRIYFTTRDLLLMAAQAALGGVVSNYVHAVEDFFQSIFGFAGTTQRAAGLHVLRLTLAVRLTRNQSGFSIVASGLPGNVQDK